MLIVLRKLASDISELYRKFEGDLKTKGFSMWKKENCHNINCTRILRRNGIMCDAGFEWNIIKMSL